MLHLHYPYSLYVFPSIVCSCPSLLILAILSAGMVTAALPPPYPWTPLQATECTSETSFHPHVSPLLSSHLPAHLQPCKHERRDGEHDSRCPPSEEVVLGNVQDLMGEHTGRMKCHEMRCVQVIILGDVQDLMHAQLRGV